MKKESAEKIVDAGIQVVAGVISVTVTVISVTAEILGKAIRKKWRRD